MYKLQKIQEVTLAFYKNGILFDSTFYLYDSKEAIRALDDLQEGYYPFFFKTQYPEGVLMNVVGEIDSLYNPTAKN